MPEPTPTGLTLTLYSTVNTVSWYNEDDYEWVVILKGFGSESVSDYDVKSGPMTTGTTSSFDDPQITPYNTAVKYAVKAYRPPYDPSDVSSEVTNTRWSETLTDTVNLSDSQTNTMAMSETLTDTINVSDSVATVCVFTVVLSDTINVGDSAMSGASIKTDFEYYWGTETGLVNLTNDSKLSDSGESISAYWTSKAIDCAEMDPNYTGRWKALYKVRYLGRDITAETPVVIKVSNDGGATWTTKEKYVGNDGDGRTVSKDFHYIETGQFFTVKIEWASTDKDFQFLGLMMDFDDNGEQFG